MLPASRVLEAFGNARTINNGNSSRFGKLTWLLFSRADGEREAELRGSHIEVCLLEKSRLIAQAAGERNFHVFYQLCAAASAAPPAGADGADEVARSPGSELGLPSLAPASEWALRRRRRRGLRVPRSPLRRRDHVPRLRFRRQEC